MSEDAPDEHEPSASVEPEAGDEPEADDDAVLGDGTPRPRTSEPMLAFYETEAFDPDELPGTAIRTPWW